MNRWPTEADTHPIHKLLPSRQDTSKPNKDSENGNYNVCWNDGEPSAFSVTYSWKRESYIKLTYMETYAYCVIHIFIITLWTIWAWNLGKCYMFINRLNYES